MKTIWVERDEQKGGYRFCSRRKGGNIVAIGENDARMILDIIHDETNGIATLLKAYRHPFTVRQCEETIIQA